MAREIEWQRRRHSGKRKGVFYSLRRQWPSPATKSLYDVAVPAMITTLTKNTHDGVARDDGVSEVNVVWSLDERKSRQASASRGEVARARHPTSDIRQAHQTTPPRLSTADMMATFV